MGQTQRQLESAVGVTTGAEREFTREDAYRLLGITPEVYAQALLFTYPDMTAEELAEKVGVSRRTLYRWPGVGRTLRARQLRR